jgi:hypothetical protein
MTTKIAISIGKGLGKLIKVEDSRSDKLTFRSFLRLLVEINVCNPLKPGFSFRRDGGESLWIFLKYERLDIYCTSCGIIGHKSDHCMAPPEERFPGNFLVSLHVSIFLNLPHTSPITKNHTSIASTSSQPPSSQFRSPESNQSHKDNLIPVPKSQNPHAVTSPLQQKFSNSLVTSPHISTAILGSKLIPSTDSLLITSTSTPAYTTTPPQPLLLPTSQNKPLVTNQPPCLLELNQNLTKPPTQNQPSIYCPPLYHNSTPFSLLHFSMHFFSANLYHHLKITRKKNLKPFKKILSPKKYSVSTLPSQTSKTPLQVMTPP